MNVDHESDGRWRFSLGPVERWVVALAALALGTLVGLLFNSFVTRMDKQGQTLDEQGRTLQTVVTQQAVTNEQLQTLSSQLADVPGLTRQIAEMKVRQDEHERRINRLEDGSTNPKLRGWTR